MLDVNGLEAGYRVGVPVLTGLSFGVAPGPGTGIVGRNGAGKTCLALALVGIHKATGGSIRLDGADITKHGARRRCTSGLALVPEGRLIFSQLSVYDNLVAAAYGVGRKVGADDLAYLTERFPVLGEKMEDVAGSMSGGEQQMLAIARCLIQRPKLLVLDEPSLGLAPVAIEALAETIRKVQDDGVAVLLLEQNRYLLSALCGQVHVLDRGRIVRTVPADELDDETMVEAAIGEGADGAGDDRGAARSAAT